MSCLIDLTFANYSHQYYGNYIWNLISVLEIMWNLALLNRFIYISSIIAPIVKHIYTSLHMLLYFA